jgi:hypothetical protein
MRRSTVLCLPLQLVFPGSTFIVETTESLIFKLLQETANITTAAEAAQKLGDISSDEVPILLNLFLLCHCRSFQKGQSQYLSFPGEPFLPGPLFASPRKYWTRLKRLNCDQHKSLICSERERRRNKYQCIDSRASPTGTTSKPTTMALQVEAAISIW